ncbi:MAG: mechanosensitive ion channel family protein, partial [Rubrivivax sp.]|nr:mechanosensitive ion channel family protein [Rubrivivax sp.]
LRDIAANEARVLATPAPMIKVDQLGDSSVNILFRVWTARTDWLDTKLDLIQRCKEGLEAGGITIPFPQRDVHLHTAPGTPAERDPYPVPVAQSRGLA